MTSDTNTTGTDPGTAGLAHDYLNLDSLFSAEELALRDQVRAFVAERIRPNIAAWYEAAYFPREIVREMGALGLLGIHLNGYGCPGRSALEYGLAALELEAGDSGLRRDRSGPDDLSVANWDTAANAGLSILSPSDHRQGDQMPRTYARSRTRRSDGRRSWTDGATAATLAQALRHC
jgi:hypothetical protein